MLRAVCGKSDMSSVFAPNAVAARLSFYAMRSIIPNSARSQAPN